ncbi:sodium:proton antiporter [Leptolyngbya sp. Heron Island J]|uniref:cation:proton antiporter domain-containing protein n=1 Tax=Leptolyngbya sp. Heron Island J TaxID=1385935 RepID=UPI0003B9BD12|nr:cation:proton antiporter [Leptolyngbya sp. Heron Island J]ESA33260.1 sodium:proton antiporter [Leptolyngbya sp. Heron Island J]
MDGLRELIIDNPLVAFTTLLLVSLTLPPLFERLRLPGLVGLLFAGVVLGPSVLGLLDPAGDIEKLFADVGKVYLMFVAALEIDLKEFSRNRDRAMKFGFLTFAIPLMGGILLGRWTGFGWVAAVLIGSLMSSHTLLAYPIIMRLGVTHDESVTVTVGATIFTDIAALLVLAVCASLQGGDFSPFSLTLQMVGLAVYTAAVLFGLNWAGRLYFRRTGSEQGNQFLFVLLAVFLAAVGAQTINVDKVVGAFLAGLAVNGVVGDGPVKEKVEFVGSVLFIPFFFVCMGLLLDVPIFIEALTDRLGLTVGIVLVLLLAKFLAAAIAGLWFRYSPMQILTMWSLSLPQVAATLAAALVGLQVGLITAPVFNAVIVLMLVTSLVGSTTTSRFASQLPLPAGPLITDGTDDWLEPAGTPSKPFVVVVPLSNISTQRYLVEMAAFIAQHEKGYVVPLAIAPAHAHMDDPQLLKALTHHQKILQAAQAISDAVGTEARPQIRIDDDIAQGISRTTREYDAQLVVMGRSQTEGLRARLLGSVIDNVLWASHCPVVMTRLKKAPIELKRILIPVKIMTPQTIHTIRFGQVFAATHEASITLLHVSDRIRPAQDLQRFKGQLRAVMAEGDQVEYGIKCVRHDDPAAVILAAARHVDLVILRSMRRRTAGGLAVSDVTHQVIDTFTCSVVLFGEPHS